MCSSTWAGVFLICGTRHSRTAACRWDVQAHRDLVRAHRTLGRTRAGTGSVGEGADLVMGRTSRSGVQGEGRRGGADLVPQGQDRSVGEERTFSCTRAGTGEGRGTVGEGRAGEGCYTSVGMLWGGRWRG